MNTYTIIAYVLPAGGHHVETVTGPDPTTAAVQLRDKLELKFEEFEIVAITAGKIDFVEYDVRQLALAPFSPGSP
jgi:hypothetical protein